MFSQARTDLNASSELDAAAPRGNIVGGEGGGCIAGDGCIIGGCGTGVADEPLRTCAVLATPPRVLPEPAMRLGGRVAGHGRPFLLTHTIRCMPTQNSAIESLLSPSASASCQICRSCCNQVATRRAKRDDEPFCPSVLRFKLRLNHSLLTKCIGRSKIVIGLNLPSISELHLCNIYRLQLLGARSPNSHSARRGRRLSRRRLVQAELRKLTSRGRRDLEKSSTASTPVTNPSRSESYTGNIDSYFDLSWPDMTYGSAARGGSGGTTNALPDRGMPCETEPAGGGGAFCILASGRGRALSTCSRDAEIGTPGDACQSKDKPGHRYIRNTKKHRWQRNVVVVALNTCTPINILLLPHSVRA